MHGDITSTQWQSRPHDESQRIVCTLSCLSHSIWNWFPLMYVFDMNSPTNQTRKYFIISLHTSSSAWWIESSKETPLKRTLFVPCRCMFPGVVTMIMLLEGEHSTQILNEGDEVACLHAPLPLPWWPWNALVEIYIFCQRVHFTKEQLPYHSCPYKN